MSSVALEIGTLGGLVAALFATGLTSPQPAAGSSSPPPSTATTGADSPGAAPDGAAVFAVRCKFCHDPSAFGAPPLTDLRTFTQARVFEALTSGKMVENAEGLSPEEKHAVAGFVTGNAAPHIPDSAPAFDAKPR